MIVALAVLPSPASAQENPLAHAVDALRRHEATLASLATTVELRHLPPQVLDADTNLADPLEPLETHTLELVLRPNRIAMKRTIGTQTIQSFWTGSAWYEFEQNTRQWRVSMFPPVDPETNCLALFNGTCMGTFIGGQPISIILESLRLDSVNESEGAVTFAGALQGFFNVTVVVEMAPHFRIREVTYEIPSSTTELGIESPKVRTRYHVAEWMDFDNTSIPKLAYRDVYSLRREMDEARGRKPAMYRTVIRRLSIHRPLDEQIQDSCFVPRFAEGELVVDDRQALVATVGGLEISVDNVHYRLTEPFAPGTGDFLDTLSLESPLGQKDARSLTTRIVMYVVAMFAVGWWMYKRKSRAANALAVLFPSLLLSLSFGCTRQPQAQSGGPVATNGDRSHDFGIVDFEGDSLELSHDFELRNTGETVVNIVKIAATCGCTEAKADSTTIVPGERTKISVTLKLNTPARRSERVTVVLDNQEVVTFGVSAAGRVSSGMYALEGSIPLVETKNGRVHLVFTTVSADDEPAAPTIDVPEGVEAVFRGWRAFADLNTEMNGPARYHAVVALRLIGNTLDDDDALVIGLSSHSIRVGLNGRPWRSVSAEESRQAILK